MTFSRSFPVTYQHQLWLIFTYFLVYFSMRNRFWKFYKTDHQGSSKNIRNSVGFNSLVLVVLHLSQFPYLLITMMKFIYLWIGWLTNVQQALPSQHLLVQSQPEKYQNNVSNLFRVNNKNTRTTSITCSKKQ